MNKNFVNYVKGFINPELFKELVSLLKSQCEELGISVPSYKGWKLNEFRDALTALDKAVEEQRSIYREIGPIKKKFIKLDSKLNKKKKKKVVRKKKIEDCFKKVLIFENLDNETSKKFEGDPFIKIEDSDKANVLAHFEKFSCANVKTEAATFDSLFDESKTSLINAVKSFSPLKRATRTQMVHDIYANYHVSFKDEIEKRKDTEQVIYEFAKSIVEDAKERIKGEH